jgi:hypothetical protein
MQSSNEKEEEIPTTNYKILNTILTEKKIPKTIKKVFLISTFLISLILLIIQTQKIKKVKEKNQNLLLINKNLSQIFSPKVIPYKSKNHLDSIIDNVFYPYKSDIIETMEDLNFLRETLGKVGLRLEYKAKIHGDNVVKFQEKTKTHHHHLLLIKTKKGNRFGGYTSVNFEPSIMAGFSADVEKIDPSAFLFNLDDKKVYNVTQGLSAVYCDTFFVAHFGEGDLVLWDNFLRDGGMSDFPENYGKGANKGELTKEGRKFNVSNVEVYHVNFYEQDFDANYDVKGRFWKSYTDYK